MFRTAFIFLFTLASTILYSTAAYADDSLDASADPQYPTPYSTVSIKPLSSSLQLSSATITVSANGVVVGTGTGSESFSVPIGAPGKTVRVIVKATIDGQTYAKELIFTPQDLSLIIEPQTSTHPFYEGESLISQGSAVRLVALADFRTADGKKIPASSLVYSWNAAGQDLLAQSGIGKNVLSAVAPPRYRDTAVTVLVSTPDGSIASNTQVPIVSQEPLVRIYKNHPLLGPDYANAISGSITMSDAEQMFRIVPYFFAETPSFSWTLNSKASGSDRDITVRSTGSGAGSATISGTAALPNALQSATQTFNLSFGASQSLGIFGL